MYEIDNWFEDISECDNCGFLRKQIDLDNAPFEHRKWAEANNYFWVFYCPNCSEWGTNEGI